MLALRPPFDASNPITMASAIVEGRYPSLEPLVARIGGGDRKGSGGPYSAALVGLVGRLMTIDKEKRPSISEVAAASAPYLMRSMDKIQSDNDRLREDAIREGRRRAADSTLERRKREALRKLTGLAHDDDDGAGSSGAATGDVSETETDASGDGDAAAAGDRATNSGSGARSGSGASTPRLNSGRSFKIAPDRLRAVADPLSQILSTLHKLVFIDQLPPGSRRDPRRASIVRYKRALFAGSNHAGFIKAEAAKLSAGSREEVAIGDARLLGGGDGACTYETLGRAMEELLREHRFYQLGARGNDA
jgi:NIMA (never in mitosis gene a)-related kinase